jgi:hypothetical protein
MPRSDQEPPSMSHRDDHVQSSLGSLRTAEGPELVGEHPQPLVARPREAEPIGLGADATTQLGGRELAVVEPREQHDELDRYAWGEPHRPTLAADLRTACGDSVTTRASNTVLQSRTSR